MSFLLLYITKTHFIIQFVPVTWKKIHLMEFSPSQNKIFFSLPTELKQNMISATEIYLRLALTLVYSQVIYWKESLKINLVF